MLDPADPIVIEIRAELQELHQAVFGNDPSVRAPVSQPPLQDQVNQIAATLGKLVGGLNVSLSGSVTPKP